MQAFVLEETGCEVPRQKKRRRSMAGAKLDYLNVNGLLLGSACVQYWTKALLDGLSRITT
jgi:hypothetical protein